MALTAHAPSSLAEIVSLIAFRKGLVLEAGMVRSMYFLSSDILILLFVMNHLENEVPSCLSALW